MSVIHIIQPRDEQRIVIYARGGEIARCHPVSIEHLHTTSLPIKPRSLTNAVKPQRPAALRNLDTQTQDQPRMQQLQDEEIAMRWTEANMPAL